MSSAEIARQAADAQSVREWAESVRATHNIDLPRFDWFKFLIIGAVGLTGALLLRGKLRQHTKFIKAREAIGSRGEGLTTVQLEKAMNNMDSGFTITEAVVASVFGLLALVATLFIQ